LSYYQFQPMLCFNARCWWQHKDKRLDCRHWPPAASEAMPVWVTFDSGDRDDGWVRCEPEPPRQSDKILCNTFWFGVYALGEQYAYDIRPAYSGATLELWPRLERVLDTNIDGYLGMYDVPTEPYRWYEPTAPLWQLEGLDPASLAPGARRCNLQWYSPKGKAVRRISDLTRSYLDDWKGVRGMVSLEVHEVPVPPHPRPKT